jgi:hypothetical protein
MEENKRRWGIWSKMLWNTNLRKEHKILGRNFWGSKSKGPLEDFNPKKRPWQCTQYLCVYYTHFIFNHDMNNTLLLLQLHHIVFLIFPLFFILVKFPPQPCFILMSFFFSWYSPLFKTIMAHGLSWKKL